MDINTIIAGLLHDTLEDTDLSKKDLTKEFGKDIPIESAYRDYFHQQVVKADVKAKAGKSNHGLGIALDILGELMNFL